MAAGTVQFCTYPPTARQLDALRFIAGFQEAHGFSPSLEQIAAGLGIRRRSGVMRMLRCLEERGHVRRLPNRARAIHLTHPVSMPRAPDGAPLYSVPLGMVG